MTRTGIIAVFRNAKFDLDNVIKKFIQDENEKLAGLFSKAFVEFRKNFKQNMDERFEKVDKRFENVDERFDDLEISIGKRHQEIDEFDDWVKVLERKSAVR